MPSQKNIDSVADITQKLQSAKSSALFQYQGLNAADITSLRDRVKTNGGVIEVFKNTLITRALENIGIKLDQELVGPTAIAFCQENEVAPLKEIEKTCKEKEKTEFKYGIFDKKLLSFDDLKKILSLPSKSALISQFINDLINPLQRLVYALRYNQTQLVLILKVISEKKK